MGTSIRPSRALFAAVMIGLGIIGLIYGNSALIWEPIRKTLPGRPVIIYLCAVIEIGTGIGLLLRASVILACRVLFPFLLLWLALLKLPGLFLAPHVMVSWEAFGEIAATSAGGWCLFAAHAGAWEEWHLKFAIGESGIRAARLLLVAALAMIGLSHFVYHDLTASLVPKMDALPPRLDLPDGRRQLGGRGGDAVRRLSASRGEPRGRDALDHHPARLGTAGRLHAQDQGDWTEFFISSAIATGTWVVADTYRSVPWVASGEAAHAVSPG